MHIGVNVHSRKISLIRNVMASLDSGVTCAGGP